MDDRALAALEALISSKKYAMVCEDTVRRAFARALSRYRTVKEADKAARAALHQITGAFMTEQQLRAARACLEQDLQGDAGALSRCLALHASTRERPGWEALYARVFEICGRPQRVLDLACGLNPLALGALGVRVRGVDIHKGAVALVNAWARAHGWDVEAAGADLLEPIAFEPADLALMMKLLPVLERQQAGYAAALIERVPARWKLVTFPTRTLGGRGVGMQAQYGQWMQRNMPQDHLVAARFVVDDELCFILEGAHG